MKVIRIGLDTSKHVFQIHGVDEDEQAGLQRSAVAKFFATLAPTRISIEACGASHHWGSCAASGTKKVVQERQSHL